MNERRLALANNDVGRLILEVARSRARRHWRSYTTLDDQIGAVTVAICERLPQFNDSRGNLAAFCTVVADSHLKNLDEYESAARRDCRLRTELEPLGGRLRDACASPEDLVVSAIDGARRCIEIDAAIEALPGELGDICVSLRNGESKEDIARRLGMSKNKLYRGVRRIRRAFSARGLGD